ncbi:hypothetical protein LUR56_40720 [Streptomyces sp. MT29]|nr:hypothetical protein [Streptomyces sp. MT29]
MTKDRSGEEAYLAAIAAALGWTLDPAAEKDFAQASQHRTDPSGLHHPPHRSSTQPAGDLVEQVPRVPSAFQLRTWRRGVDCSAEIMAPWSPIIELAPPGT